MSRPAGQQGVPTQPPRAAGRWTDLRRSRARSTARPNSQSRPWRPVGALASTPKGRIGDGRMAQLAPSPGMRYDRSRASRTVRPHATWVLHADRTVRVATAAVTGLRAAAPRKPLDPGVRPPTRVHRALHPRWCREMSGRLSGTNLNCVLPTARDSRKPTETKATSKRLPGLSWRRQRQRSSDAVPTRPAFHTLAFVRRFAGCAPG